MMVNDGPTGINPSKSMDWKGSPTTKATKHLEEPQLHVEEVAADGVADAIVEGGAKATRACEDHGESHVDSKKT